MALRDKRDKREGERFLLVSQLQRSIDVENTMVKTTKKLKKNQGKVSQDSLKKRELLSLFLEDVLQCHIDDFEKITTKWIRKMRR